MNVCTIDEQMKREGEEGAPQPRPLLGYWAAQEQSLMQDLLIFVVEAEKGGFTTTMTSDHFHPWWHDNALVILLGSGLLQQQNVPRRCTLLQGS